jgi:hypothetical protein
MELELLRSFLALAAQLHFGRTARLLNVSQPALTWFPALLRSSAGVLQRCRLNSETCRHVNNLSASVPARSTSDLCASRLLTILSNFRSFRIPWPLSVLWSRRESAICAWRIAGKRHSSCYPLNVPRLFVSILCGSAPNMDSPPDCSGSS